MMGDRYPTLANLLAGGSADSNGSQIPSPNALAGAQPRSAAIDEALRANPTSWWDSLPSLSSLLRPRYPWMMEPGYRRDYEARQGLSQHYLEATRGMTPGLAQEPQGQQPRESSRVDDRRGDRPMTPDEIMLYRILDIEQRRRRSQNTTQDY